MISLDEHSLAPASHGDPTHDLLASYLELSSFFFGSFLLTFHFHTFTLMLLTRSFSLWAAQLNRGFGAFSGISSFVASEAPGVPQNFRPRPQRTEGSRDPQGTGTAHLRLEMDPELLISGFTLLFHQRGDKHI